MAKANGGRQDGSMRAALLLRVSDSRQAGADRFSLEAQREAAHALCRRRGWVVVTEYVGAGESAFTRDIDRRQTVRSILRDATQETFLRRRGTDSHMTITAT
jgi:DNA invertase Pin-like site-specific DNA recombinase